VPRAALPADPACRLRHFWLFVRLVAWVIAEENRPAEENLSETTTYLPSSGKFPSKFDRWLGQTSAVPPDRHATRRQTATPRAAVPPAGL
jgi:hypothetical protein